jgi:hypothetical protein
MIECGSKNKKPPFLAVLLDFGLVDQLAFT